MYRKIAGALIALFILLLFGAYFTGSDLISVITVFLLMTVYITLTCMEPKVSLKVDEKKLDDAHKDGYVLGLNGGMKRHYPDKVYRYAHDSGWYQGVEDREHEEQEAERQKQERAEMIQEIAALVTQQLQLTGD